MKQPDDFENKIIAVKKAIRLYKFHSLWDRTAKRQEIFECANKVREYCGLTPFDYETFDIGWQYRTVLHCDYKVARIEFLNLCLGWW